MQTINITTKFVLAAAIFANCVTAAPAYSVLDARKEDNPTYGDHTGSKSQYPDGSGKYIKSDDDHRYASGHKCWTDYFAITEKTHNRKDDKWEKVGNEIHCGNESTCSMNLSKGSNKCSSSSLTITAQAGFSILKGLFDAGITVTQEYTKSQCEAVSFTNTCSWERVGSTKCRQVWGRTNYEVVPGYIRRRCDFKNGKGDQTVWSKDLDMVVPKNQSLDCDLECSDDANNPKPKTTAASAPTSTKRNTTTSNAVTSVATKSATTRPATKPASKKSGSGKTNAAAPTKATSVGSRPATVTPTTSVASRPTTVATGPSSPTGSPTGTPSSGDNSPSGGDTTPAPGGDDDVPSPDDDTPDDDTPVGDDTPAGDNAPSGVTVDGDDTVEGDVVEGDAVEGDAVEGDAVDDAIDSDDVDADVDADADVLEGDY